MFGFYKNNLAIGIRAAFIGIEAVNLVLLYSWSYTFYLFIYLFYLLHVYPSCLKKWVTN